MLPQIARSARAIWEHPGNRGQRLRRLAGYAAWQLYERITGGSVVVPLGERSKIIVPALNWPGARVVRGNPPDVAEMSVWRRRLRPGDLFVDVGANIGNYTIFTAELGCNVIAVEPGKVALERLRENIALNGYGEQVMVIEGVLAAESGSATITRDLDSVNYLLVDGPGPESVSVPSLTFDEIVGDRHVHGVKIDVEGAELLVLQGAVKALGERRIDAIQMEWNFWSRERYGVTRDEIAGFLSSYGYSTFTADTAGRLTRARPAERDVARREEDVFALPD